MKQVHGKTNMKKAAFENITWKVEITWKKHCLCLHFFLP